MMKQLFGSLMAIVDVIMPPKARTVRAKALTIEKLSLAPTTHELLGARIVTLMDYRTQDVQDVIQSLKYDAASSSVRLCAEALAEYLAEEISEARLFSQKRVLLVPVPLHASRARARGYNQIGLVLESLPQEFRDGTHASLAADTLVRVRATVSQTRLPRSERLSNVAGAFALCDGIDVKGSRVFLIDDVATTGATLANAANPLKRAGADVTLVALARA